ncbi:hypothetical protein L484_005744 [Morus notabilis]|uniref:Uncharacterized protein n=1 Tax=Morus notabilis TaxID=981085 RepID=W9RJZ1_9ROSA|nr:hypothetical protein L484_005744 [Morus notabilis]
MKKRLITATIATKIAVLWLIMIFLAANHNDIIPLAAARPFHHHGDNYMKIKRMLGAIQLQATTFYSTDKTPRERPSAPNPSTYLPCPGARNCPPRHR